MKKNHIRSSRKKFVPALGFHQLTWLYDCVADCAGFADKYLSVLLTQAQLEASHCVLDLGSGTGLLAIKIKQLLPDIQMTALDCDHKVLSIAERKARKMHVNVQFIRGFAQYLPYQDNAFDRVFSSLLFHHLSLSDKKRAAAETLRVLRPGGEFYLLDWGRAANPVMRGLFLAVQLVDGFDNTRDNVAGKLPEMLQQAGFVAVEQQQTFNTVFGTLALYRAEKES